MEKQMEEALASQVEAMQHETEKQLKERSAQLEAKYTEEFTARRARFADEEAHNVSEYSPILSPNGANSNIGKSGTRTCSWTRKAEAGGGE
jgi:Zn-dependent M16 (insulinase) family peptidase